jgi:hypothetical protein
LVLSEYHDENKKRNKPSRPTKGSEREMKTKSKSSQKKKPIVRVRDLTSRKDVKGGLGDIKGESGDSKHKDEIEVLKY